METVGKTELSTIIETVQHQEDCLSRLGSAMDSVLATIPCLEGNVKSLQSQAPVLAPAPTPLPAFVPSEPVREHTYHSLYSETLLFIQCNLRIQWVLVVF